MDLYAGKSPSIPQKLTVIAIELALIALSAWLMFGPGEQLAANLFGFAPAGEPPLRRWIVLAFSLIILMRMSFMMFVLMKRTMPWSETASVPLAFALYYVGFALLVLPSRAPLDALDIVAIALFILGCYLNTASEWQRHLFKADPDNKGRLYTGGLFNLSMHVNFFGDIVWVTAYALIARNPWGALIPVFLTGFFAFYNVPMLDRHLAARYGNAFETYAKSTKRLIPFVW